MKNKEKYDLRDITYVIDVHGCKYEFVIYHNSIEVYRENFDILSPACSVFTKWLEQEYKPPILDEVEKSYLSAFIKPFRKRIKYIERMDNSFVNGNQYQFLCISLTKDYCCLPLFKKDTMYKGMEVNKRYTLEELGL